MFSIYCVIHGSMKSAETEQWEEGPFEVATYLQITTDKGHRRKMLVCPIGCPKHEQYQQRRQKVRLAHQA